MNYFKKGKDVNRNNDYIGKTSTSSHHALERQIANIVLRQQELQNYISRIEQGIKGLEGIIRVEKQQKKQNYDKIKNCYIAISKHIELVTKLYDSYRAFEDTKFKYHKQIAESNFKYIHLIEVEIRRIEEKMDNTLGDSGFVEVMQALAEGFRNNSDADPMIQQSKEELLTDSSYKL